MGAPFALGYVRFASTVANSLGNTVLSAKLVQFLRLAISVVAFVLDYNIHSLFFSSFLSPASDVLNIFL